MSGEDVIEKTEHEEKVNELAGMSGIAEGAAEAEAIKIFENLSTEESDEEGYTPEVEETGEDKIVAEEKEEGEKVEEKEDPNEIDLNKLDTKDPEVAKLVNTIKQLRKSNKKVVKKLSTLEREVATRWSDQGKAQEEVIIPPIDTDYSDILTDIGIEDPDEPMTAKQALEFNKRVDARRKTGEEARNAAKVKFSASQQRVIDMENKFKKDHSDFDDLIKPILDDRMVNTSPNFDAKFTDFIMSRVNPAAALYEFAKGEIGDIEGDNGDPKILAALKLREEKEAALTLGNKTNTKVREGSAITKAHSVFSQMQSMNETELAAFQEKHGAD